MFKGIKILSAVALAISLYGCGGGGVTTPSAVKPTPFTSYPAITYPSVMVARGYTQQTSYTEFGGIVTSPSTPSTFASGASFTESLNSSRQLTGLTMVSASGTTISLSTAKGDTLAVATVLPTVLTSYSNNLQNQIWGVSMELAGWNYQSFGVWETGIGTGSGTMGAMTFGAETSPALIPTTGIYTFSGVADGLYTNSAGKLFAVSSSMTANTDFATRSISFVTTGSQTSLPGGITATLNTSLNMNGTLSYASGSNQFNGPVTTIGGGAANVAMTGNATGKFYGPAAEEIGGTFAVSGGSVTRFIGGFGGK